MVKNLTIWPVRLQQFFVFKCAVSQMAERRTKKKIFNLNKNNDTYIYVQINIKYYD